MLEEAKQDCFCIHPPQLHREPRALHPTLLPEVPHRSTQQPNVTLLPASPRGRDLDTEGRSIGTTS